MLREKDLDRETIETYHAWVQQGIKNDLNSVSLGPGRLPYRSAVALVVFAFACLLVGILLVALRMRHVYLWDWDSQFLGPFFVILFLLCMAGATYLIILAKRRSNKYRSQLYFKPVGDWGVHCVHKSELAREEEMKHELKSGTTPHKTVKPRSEAYSQSSKDARRGRPPGYRNGRDNQGYDKSPLDANKPFRPDDRRRGPPPDGYRGPDDRRRGPPPDGYRGPPPDGRRGPPPDGRRGPPPDGRRGPPPDGRRGPPPGDRRGPPGDRMRDPPPEYSQVDRHHPDDRMPHPNDRPRRSPPPNGHRGPDDRRPPPGGAARIPPDEDHGRRPRGVPRFGGVERIPDEDRNKFRLIGDQSRDESDI